MSYQADSESACGHDCGGWCDAEAERLKDDAAILNGAPDAD